MAESELPSDVVQFVHQFINRLETLDVLIALHGDPNRAGTKSEMSGHLRSSPAASGTVLDRLVASGLAERTGEAYVYRPRRHDLAEKVARLVACNRERRNALITAIFTRTSDAVRSFADAFRIKKGSD